MRPHVVLALGCTWIVGCADGVSDSSEPGDDQAIVEAPGARTPIVATPAKAKAPPAEPLSFQCRSAAFCEDFESPDPESRWTGAVGSGLQFVAPSATKGARSLRVTSAAYLR